MLNTSIADISPNHSWDLIELPHCGGPSSQMSKEKKPLASLEIIG
jgi:hypothetical protein